MELFLTFKFLHIVSMFFAVALAISGEIVVRRVAQSGDARVIHATIERIKFLAGPASGALFIAGLVFGLLAALAGQIDLLRPWLIASYVLFGLAFAIGMGIVDPWVARLESATAAGAGAGAGNLAEVIADPKARAGSWALQVVVAALVALMVFKPLG